MNELQVRSCPVDQLVPYPQNPRTHSEQQVARIAASMQEVGWTNPILIGPDKTVIAGHARLAAARKLGMSEVPTIALGHLTPAQQRALVIADNQLALNAGWDEELLRVELLALQEADYDLDVVGFDAAELDRLLAAPTDVDAADHAPPVPEVAAEPSYMKRRTKGHTNTSISEDTRADWSEAFALVPTLDVAYVWHASKFTREVLDGLLGIGFLHHQQIIWDKGRTVLTRTHYWFQHEPCWYVRGKNAPWFGKAGENSTVWCSPSPKFIMGGSDEEKFDHPTQKPVDLMRRPILNHLKRGELVYDPFLGSGTTLAAAELTHRVCHGLELDPKYADVIVQRWRQLTGAKATLDGDGRTFEEIGVERVKPSRRAKA